MQSSSRQPQQSSQQSQVPAQPSQPQPPQPSAGQPGRQRSEQPVATAGTPAPAPAVSIDKPSATIPDKPSTPPAGPAAEDDTTEVLTEPIDPASPTPPAAPVPPDVARARALLIPVADPSRAAQYAPEVAPVLPGTPSAARPTVRRPGDEHTPYGDACPWCGTSNQPERHFCRRCAMRLAETPGGPKRRPWWRRLLDFRGREAPWAGERPRLRRDLGRIVRWTLTLAVAVALVVTVSMEATPATHAIEDHFATRVPIHQFVMTASHSSPQQPPAQAEDSYNNTAWGSGYGGPNTGQWLMATFASPQHLLNVIITPCAGSESDLEAVEACPQQLEAVITNNAGKKSTQVLELNDGGAQTFNMDYRDVTSVQFIVQSLYGASPQKQVAVAELEFFGPSAS
ncbi:zinc ribbon domain-containing protein [Streptacidiphilus sp. 4-A2]|nr:zinc ribbon domain-containing protein [Streptacidiphilus sp. 4-A2]